MTINDRKYNRLNLVKIIKKDRIDLIPEIAEGGYYGLRQICPFNLLGYATSRISKKMTRIHKKRLIKLHGKVCSYCFKQLDNSDITLDHIIPTHDGGSNRPSNLVIACPECNNKKDCLGIVQFLLEKYSNKW